MLEFSSRPIAICQFHRRCNRISLHCSPETVTRRTPSTSGKYACLRNQRQVLYNGRHDTLTVVEQRCIPCLDRPNHEDADQNAAAAAAGATARRRDVTDYRMS